MKSSKKKSEYLFPAALAVCLLLFLLFGGFYFTGYLRHQIFVERSTQLGEITAQVRVNLDSALDTHWNYLTAAVNALEGREFSGSEDISAVIQELEELIATRRYDSSLMLLDSHGNSYDTDGKHGVWADISLISDGKERYTFISDSIAAQGSYWAFVQKLETPLPAGTSGDSFTHAVLLKDVNALSQYYNSGAYSSQSGTNAEGQRYGAVDINTHQLRSVRIP